MHEEWTDKLSEYLDDELSPRERQAVESHLCGCAECAAVLDDLTRVVERAQRLDRRPPRADLWDGIAARIETRGAAPRRVSFTLPQLAAAAVVLIAASAGIAWQFADRTASRSADIARSTEAQSRASSGQDDDRNRRAQPADHRSGDRAGAPGARDGSGQRLFERASRGGAAAKARPAAPCGGAHYRIRLGLEGLGVRSRD